MPHDYFKKLSASMPKRLKLVLESKCNMTKYILVVLFNLEIYFLLGIFVFEIKFFQQIISFTLVNIFRCSKKVNCTKFPNLSEYVKKTEEIVKFCYVYFIFGILSVIGTENKKKETKLHISRFLGTYLGKLYEFQTYRCINLTSFTCYH